MTDRPILFSAPMVRALLDGRKTQTRRVLRVPAPFDPSDDISAEIATGFVEPQFRRGDRLWVKECWNAFAFSEDGEDAWPTRTIPTAGEMAEIREAAYRVDVQAVYRESDRARQWFADQKWRPSIHMPRWASRLTLTVTDVRVQRLQDISEVDAVAEGIERMRSGRGYYDITVSKGAVRAGIWHHKATDAFESLWDSLNVDRAPWASNPWVVALTFTVQRSNIDQVEVAA